MIWAGFFLVGFIAGVVVSFIAMMIYGALNDDVMRESKLLWRSEDDEKPLDR